MNNIPEELLAKIAEVSAVELMEQVSNQQRGLTSTGPNMSGVPLPPQLPPTPAKRKRVRIKQAPKRPLHPPKDDMDEPMVATDPPSEPQPGDIIQTITQDHPFIARIGIVHHLEGPRVICYLPGRKGLPSQFRVDVVDVQVVGKARLRYSKDLPEESVYADNALDKI